MKRYWSCYLPVHVAGSSGRRLIGKVFASEEEIRGAWSSCATIETGPGTVRFFRRPPAIA